MSPESSANLRPWAALWRTVKTDRWVQLTALAFVVVWLFDLLPALGWSSGQTGTGVAVCVPRKCVGTTATHTDCCCCNQTE